MNRPAERGDIITPDQTQYLKETCTMQPSFRLSIGNANAILSPSIPSTKLGETRQNLSLTNSRTPTGDQRSDIEDDDISIHTQNDRGYAAAEKVIKRKVTVEACPGIVRPAESDFGQIGSQFLPTAPRPTEPSVVTAMARDVSRSLEYYGGILEGPQWLPVNELFRIVTESSVMEALKESLKGVELLDNELEKYAKAVCPSNTLQANIGSRSMFAILTVLSKVDEIRQFIDLGLSDNDLPFRTDPIHSRPDGQLFPKNQIINHQNLERTFGRNWELRDWAAFSKYQTAMRSPFFVIDLNDRDRIIPHYELDAETVLPFTEASPVPSSNITFHSMVQRVQIHLHHYTMHKVPHHTDQSADIEEASLRLVTCVEENPYFAVKELLPEYGDRQDNEINFREEVRALAKTVGLSSHDHVIKLLATWRRGDKWSMLFPWAKSNLKNYWQQYPPQRSPEFVQWISSQCRGLAEGLQKIHRSPSEHEKDFGIHGDIKPENILLFDSQSNAYGILVISDFGYTRFHGRSTRSNTPVVGTSPTYKAPEAELGNNIARSYDMWSLGCVLLEFVTWYLRGPTGIRTFIRRRNQDDEGLIPGCTIDKFFNINRGDGLGSQSRVKASVLDWTAELKLEPHCSDYFQDLLALIETELLQPNPKSRGKCDKVAESLRRLEHTCKSRSLEYSMGQSVAIPSALSTPVTTMSSDPWNTMLSDGLRESTASAAQESSYSDTWGSDSDHESADRIHRPIDRTGMAISKVDSGQERGKGSFSQSKSGRHMEGELTERTPLIIPTLALHPPSCLYSNTTNEEPRRQLNQGDNNGDPRGSLENHGGPCRSQQMDPSSGKRSEVETESGCYWQELKQILRCCFASSEDL